jgi:hypothetical protein
VTTLSAFELDLDDRGHLVEAAASASDARRSYLADHRLHVRAVHDRVGELAEAPPFRSSSRLAHAELHRELGLQLVLGPVVDQRVGMLWLVPTATRLTRQA